MAFLVLYFYLGRSELGELERNCFTIEHTPSPYRIALND